MSNAQAAKRIIGITRVSAEGDRETVHSYAAQAAAIEREAAGDQLLYIGQERNVSGGASLTNRPELSKAVAAVERGEADVIVAAYFDRFFRSLEVQGEVIRRIEAAGGELLTLDHGMLTNATPAKRMTANIIGAISQYFREQTAQKTREGHAEAVAAGRLPYPNVPLGYLKGPDGILAVDEVTAPIVVELFERRLRGESLDDLCRWLGALRIRKTRTGLKTILRSRVYLGEIRFGAHKNTSAHTPLIDRAVFDAVQRTKGRSGRPTMGEPRLLARLGVLRCECGALMFLGSCKQRLADGSLRVYPFYRCNNNLECPNRRTVQAEFAEDYVSVVVRNALRDAQGRASIAESAQEAACALESANSTYESALRIFTLTGAENETAAIERLTELREARDDAQARLDQIGPGAERTVNAHADWDALSLNGRRELIRATVESVVIGPGRGVERIAVNLFGQ